jgi:hypothetical protein
VRTILAPFLESWPLRGVLSALCGPASTAAMMPELGLR